MNRREFLIAGALSLVINTGLTTAFAKALPAAPIEKEELEYQSYGDKNTESGVCCYAYNEKGMSIHFKSSLKKYWYSRDVFGEEHMTELITRAESGKGLNSYINFLRRWSRTKDDYQPRKLKKIEEAKL